MPILFINIITGISIDEVQKLIENSQAVYASNKIEQISKIESFLEFYEYDFSIYIIKWVVKGFIALLNLIKCIIKILVIFIDVFLTFVFKILKLVCKIKKVDCIEKTLNKYRESKLSKTNEKLTTILTNLQN